ncbi:beta-galactosidase/beta-glucuronidase [Opitutaceae bacterium TAV1]|nr:beta-galactosidase/beta-glucuronidase [Opitutaceae bacterium TAV1]
MTTLDLASSAGLADWRFRDTSKKTWLPAQVPGCVHTDLIREEKIPDPFYGTNELDLQWIEERDWEYTATFNVPASLFDDEQIDLVANGLDTVATVFLNGKKIAATENMFTGYRWPVKKLLRRGRNELRIHFRSAMDYIRSVRPEHTPRECNDPVGGCTRVRKMQCNFGWDWGPRLVTAGVWRDIRLEGWGTNRLVHAHLAQKHAEDGSVTLTVTPELATDAPVTVEVRVTLDGKDVARAFSAKRPLPWHGLPAREVPEARRVAPRRSGRNAAAPTAGGTPAPLTEPIILSIPDPQLWWPAGQGKQPLYDVEIIASSGDEKLNTIRKRIGLRTLVLDRHPDEWGESFRFVVNGRPVFIKGANWIPAHAFVAGLTRADYARDLRAAALANMNCVRLWGGGIYESEHFYDLCDELGLLVWHDFMFGCTLYPYDDAFVESVRVEAVYNVRRVHHRASLALWCGNNELVQINKPRILDTPEHKAGYERIFHDLLPAVIAEHDGTTPYWPSSEWSGDWETGHEVFEKRGDKHFWDVWHARKPVKDYEKYAFRFVSEFGMQSYSSPETNATFCPADDDNVFGPTMENHQKNRAGNQIILDYVSRRYRLPKSQDDLIWLSQLNQAYCMQVGIEHYRRLAPRCMGTIYWQLNDCWPVASWSSIEFTGRWKALHYAARRFNAPALVTAHVPGDEAPVIGNYRRTTVREVHLHTVYDAPVPARGVLRWDLFRIDARAGGTKKVKSLLSGKKSVTLRYGESVNQKTLDLGAAMERYGRDNIYLRIALDVGGRTVSEDTVFLAPPRFLPLPRAKTRVRVRQLGPKEFAVAFTSPVFQHRFAFGLPGLAHMADDNWFELYPGEPKEVIVTLARPATKATVEKKLRYRSLADTYA